MFDDLNEDNFMMYAMKAYVSPHCIMSEFEGDIKRIKYLKRLFRRYKITKSLKERLILKALKKHKGKRRDASLDLGISERTLYRKLKEYDIED